MMVFGVASATCKNNTTSRSSSWSDGNIAQQQQLRKRARTVRSAELRNGIDEALMELDGPPEPGLGVGGEDEARVALHAHRSII
jgi:hypothetical protein